MSPSLPPLDLHAHINIGTRSADLERLGAVVFAATRSLAEYGKTLGRQDAVTIWGVGCHPGVAEAQRAYSDALFSELVSSAQYVGEVGLDGRSRVPLADQRRVFASVLEHVDEVPRITSIHSSGAAEDVLRMLEDRPINGAVLHWWRGNAVQTREAIQLGCWFSVNHAGIKNSDDLATVPISRILTETDHPYGDRTSGVPQQPGAVDDVESALAALHGITKAAVRRQIWSNFARLVDQVGVRLDLPVSVQRMLAYVDEQH